MSKVIVEKKNLQAVQSAFEETFETSLQICRVIISSAKNY